MRNKSRSVPNALLPLSLSLVLLLSVLTGCASHSGQQKPGSTENTGLTENTGSTEETGSTEKTGSAENNSGGSDASVSDASVSDSAVSDSAVPASDPGSAEEDAGDAAPRKLRYIDAWNEWHTMDVDPSVRETAYDPEGFVRDETYGTTTYRSAADASAYEVLQGVDVSEHQGSIDWNAVAEAGYQFAFIRVGYRGYGEAGLVFEDMTAIGNLQAAKEAGLQVGAYFFSQALTGEEAREEASTALQVIERSGVMLDLPLMYDPEIIKDDWGRANDITQEQVAVNTAAFRDAVESASPWKVDIYSNLPWEHHYFDSDTMNQYDIWYADYEPNPQTPYHFVWWQYSNQGYVPGIEGRVDLNLWMRPTEQ